MKHKEFNSQQPDKKSKVKISWVRKIISIHFGLGIRRKIKKIIHIFKKEGFYALIKKIIYSFYSYNNNVVIWENNLKIKNIKCNIDQLSLIIIKNADIFKELLSKEFDLSWYEMSIHRCMERLDRGAIMFLALVGKDIAHVSWIGFQKKTHNDFFFSPINYDIEASVGGTMTNPKYRGKGIYTCVYNKIFLYIKNTGYSKAVLDANWNNIAVKRGQIKLGSIIRGKKRHLRLLWFHIKWVKKQNDI